METGKGRGDQENGTGFKGECWMAWGRKQPRGDTPDTGRQGRPFHPLSVNKQAGSEHLRVLKVQFIDSFSECLLSTCSGLQAELRSGDNDGE